MTMTPKTAPESAPAPKAKPEASAKPRPSKADAVPLQDLAKRYLVKLEEDGRSEGTVLSYRMELRLALLALGAETPVAEITQKNVEMFLSSDSVVKTRTGLPKSPLSIAKTTRVLRQALSFAVAARVIEASPFPRA